MMHQVRIEEEHHDVQEEEGKNDQVNMCETADFNQMANNNKEK